MVVFLSAYTTPEPQAHGLALRSAALPCDSEKTPRPAARRSTTQHQRVHSARRSNSVIGKKRTSQSLPPDTRYPPQPPSGSTHSPARYLLPQPPAPAPAIQPHRSNLKIHLPAYMALAVTPPYPVPLSRKRCLRFRKHPRLPVYAR